MHIYSYTFIQIHKWIALCAYHTHSLYFNAVMFLPCVHCSILLNTSWTCLQSTSVLLIHYFNVCLIFDAMAVLLTFWKLLDVSILDTLSHFLSSFSPVHIHLPASASYLLLKHLHQAAFSLPCRPQDWMWRLITTDNHSFANRKVRLIFLHILLTTSWR